MRLLRTSLYVPFGDARLYFHPRVGLLDLSVCSHPAVFPECWCGLQRCRRRMGAPGAARTAVGGGWELQALHTLAHAQLCLFVVAPLVGVQSKQIILWF